MKLIPNRFYKTMPVTVVFLMVLIAQESMALNIRNYYSPENRRRKRRKRTDYIVLHTTEGKKKGSLNKVHRRGETHYFVDRKGTVYRIIHKDRIALHAGTSMWNGQIDIDRYSLGIEMVGYYNKHISSRQVDALKELLAQLQNHYDIPDHDVLTHCMVAYGTPNRWHKRPHRGRKRCGAQFALRNIRRKLGLNKQPRYDPDVRRGRLVEGDYLLALVLYGSAAEQKTAFLQFKNANMNIIEKGRSAWDIARELYNSPRTLYIFPNGKKFYGTQIKNWKRIPAGTRIKLP